MLREFLSRFRFLVRGKSRGEVDEELQFHLEQQVNANIEAGMSPRQARRQAAIEFGGVERTREDCRAERPSHGAEISLEDVRYALRGFRRAPTFTITVLLTLMLGIGATTAVFSVVDRILFRSLPYANADRLVSVGLIAPIIPQEFMLGGSYYEWRDHQTPFEAFTSETGVSSCDLTEQNPARLNCATVEGNFLPAMGVRLFLGRNFTAVEDRPNGPRVALISYSLWQSHFGGDAGVLNKLVSLDRRQTRVIGVLPKDFEMPALEATDVVLPQALDEAEQRKADPGRVMYAFARLKPGVSADQARRELQPVFDYSLRLAPPQFRKEVHLQVRSLRDRQMHDVRLIAWVLLGVVVSVLLIACGNVASLLLARAAVRERELAVRSALGAGRFRLVRQALTESLVLSLAGGAAGFAFAEILLRVFVAMAPQGLPFLTTAKIDLRILWFTLAISLVCGIAIGIVPVLQRPRAEALAGRTAINTSHALLRKWLVVGQIAASMVLLAGGALLFRSYLRLNSQHLGMRAESVVTASISLGQSAYPMAERQMMFFQQLQRNLRYGPGISDLATSDSLPPGGDHRDQIYASLHVDGQPKFANGTGGRVAWRWVSPGYFRVLNIPIVQGRGFTEEQVTSKDHFVVLSSQLATRMFPGQDAVGRHLHLSTGTPDGPSYTIVGVVGDVKNAGLTGGDMPEYYRLRRDQAEDWNSYSSLLLKTNLPANVIEKWVRSQVAAIDPTVPVEVQTLSERVNKMADQPRFETLLVSFFASTGLLLAIVGLYGVIAFLVAQRTQEIGVRMALGANRGHILKLVLASGVRLIVLGAILGAVLALCLSRVLASMLFNIGPRDPLTFAVVTAGLIVVALLATLIPAVSAVRVDPTVALRCE
jgi:putative ABC transport system permease protein